MGSWSYQIELNSERTYHLRRRLQADLFKKNLIVLDFLSPFWRFWGDPFWLWQNESGLFQTNWSFTRNLRGLLFLILLLFLLFLLLLLLSSSFIFVAFFFFFLFISAIQCDKSQLLFKHQLSVGGQVQFEVEWNNNNWRNLLVHG